MANQTGSVTEAEAAEAAASAAAERSVAKTVGKPLGAVAGLLGFGLAIAAFGSGDHARAVAWLTLGAFGFAMMAVGRDAAGSAA